MELSRQSLLNMQDLIESIVDNKEMHLLIEDEKKKMASQHVIMLSRLIDIMTSDLHIKKQLLYVTLEHHTDKCKDTKKVMADIIKVFVKIRAHQDLKDHMLSLLN